MKMALHPLASLGEMGGGMVRWSCRGGPNRMQTYVPFSPVVSPMSKSFEDFSSNTEEGEMDKVSVAPAQGESDCH